MYGAHTPQTIREIIPGMLVVLSTQPLHIWPQDHSGQSMEKGQGQGDFTPPQHDPDPSSSNTGEHAVDPPTSTQPQHHPFQLSSALIDQAMDLWNESGNHTDLAYLDEQYQRYTSDWKSLATTTPDLSIYRYLPVFTGIYR